MLNFSGEKPFVCANCNRGYRDKRELKKHQAAHNHSGQSAPIPGTHPHPPVPPPAPAQSSQQQQQSTSNPTVIQLTNTTPTNANEKPIIIQQMISLPNTPVPRELLNGPQPVQQPQPQQQLNPATIPLPPSVATALQSINDKVTARQSGKKAAQTANVVNSSGQQQTIMLSTTPTKQEPQQQIVSLAANQAVATSGSGSGNGPLFYYFMPGNVPYNLSSDGGATVRVTTSEGNVATAQLVSVPANAIQTMATTMASTNGTAGNNVVTTAALPSWNLEGGNIVTTNRSNTM